MAFDKKTFQKRSLTAIVFAAIMLTGLLWNKWSFFLLFTIINFGCLWEYVKLINKIYQVELNKKAVIGLMLVGLSFLYLPPSLLLFPIHFDSVKFELNFVGIIGIVLFSNGFYQSKNFKSKLLIPFTLSWVYVSFSLMMMIDLFIRSKIEFFGNPLPILIIISIWLNDSFAYLIGSWIGKNPLSKISPKKTWEGTIGGILLTVFIFVVAGYYKLIDSSIHIIAIVALTTISGTFGDLFESKLKRMANVKDSGSFMPGHGGFLDRFDSLLFAIPTVWLYCKIFLK